MRRTLLVLISILFLPLGVAAQGVPGDTVWTLIISEWRGDWNYGNYLELTNIGDETVDLSKFGLYNLSRWSPFIGHLRPSPAPGVNSPGANYLRLEGTLEPGESWVSYCRTETLVDFETPYQRTRYKPGLAEIADLHQYEYEFGQAEAQDFHDSVSLFHWIHLGNNGTNGNLLYYNFDDGRDSVVVDNVAAKLINVGEYPNAQLGVGPHPVAGVVDGTGSRILVRKASVTRGNAWNEWEQKSAGVDEADSEWIVLPFNEGPVPGDKFNSGGAIFTTVKTHGDFQLDYASTVYTIDEENQTITVPWGTQRKDSIVLDDNAITLGPGMAWEYVLNADTVSSVCQTGDTLRLIACGNVKSQIDFRIEVAEPTNAEVGVYYTLKPNDDEESEYYGTYAEDAIRTYLVTEDNPVIDTVLGVPFATRIDSLYTNLDKAPNSSWEIVFVDGQNRVDLMDGDILRVTGADGTTSKDYYISVDEYEANDNDNLASITWPDKPEFIEGWVTGDTIPGFQSASLYYTITLPYGTKIVPALVAKSEDLNAKIVQKRAASLSGGLEDRTTTFRVIAEDDSTEQTYEVIFEVEIRPEDLQPFVTDPIFTKWANQYSWGNGILEWFNPGNQPLDLSGYMVGMAWIGTATSPADIITLFNDPDSTAGWKNRYQKYVPGFRYVNHLDWAAKPGVLTVSPDVNPILQPGEVFTTGHLIWWNMNTRHIDLWNKADILFNEQRALAPDRDWEEVGFGYFGGQSIGLINVGCDIAIFKIMNDSILEGTKGVFDPNDYVHVDHIGKFDGLPWNVGGTTILPANMGIRRKAHIWQGNTLPGASFGTSEEDSEWIIRDSKDSPYFGNSLHWWVADPVKAHIYTPPTIYMSTVSSLLYKVSVGYAGLQSVQGDLSSTSVNQLFTNLIKADTGQNLVVISGADGSIKAVDVNVAGSDTLRVTSADGLNTTLYELIDQPLDADALLVVKSEYSDSYEVTVDGEMGTITGSGVMWGKPVREVLEALEVPSLAMLNIINQNDEMVPLQVLNFDSTHVDVRLSDSTYFEVIAESGNTITYQLKPDYASSDAFVVSSIYLVNQDDKTISLIPKGIGGFEFLKNISPVTGATLTILDMHSFVRSSGVMSIDDKLLVVSEDGTNQVVYYLNFLEELVPDANLAPTLTLETASTNILVGESVNLKATASDDGFPLPAALTVLWEVISGDAGNVSITDAEALETDATFSEAGTYVIRITVNDGEIAVSAELTIGVATPGNEAPVVAVETASFTIEEGESINVVATAEDDGNPAGSTLTYEWTVKSGEAANVSIASPDQLETEVTFSAAGIYTLQIAVSDGELVTTEDVVVDVQEAVGIETVLAPELLMYPNPVTDVLNIELLNAGNVNSTMKLFSITGKAVSNGEFTESKLQIDMSDLDAGLYIMTVRSGEHVFMERIQIVK